jgi:hypothetical protein
MRYLLLLVFTLLLSACGSSFSADPFAVAGAGGLPSSGGADGGRTGLSHTGGKGGDSASTGGAGGEPSSGGTASAGAGGTPETGGLGGAGGGPATTGGASSGTGGAATGGASTGGVSTGGAPTCSPTVVVCGTACPLGYYKSSGCSDGGTACNCNGGPNSHCSDPCGQPKIYVCDENDSCPYGYSFVQGSGIRSSTCGSGAAILITCVLK